MGILTDKNFIEKYDGILSLDECERLISVYENSSFKEEGLVGGEIDHTRKKGKALDLWFQGDYNDPNNYIINEVIESKLRKCVQLYKKKYPLLDICLSPWYLNNHYHLQKFEEGEGYFVKHCETAHPSVASRVLVWMIYLNNATCGTRFYHQNMTMKAKCGRVVFWPAGWTHVHSGVTPNKGDKYIITGWYSMYNKNDA